MIPIELEKKPKTFTMDGIDFPVKQCLRSGFCCKQAPCQFGKWDKEKHQCQYLKSVDKGPDFEFFECAKYDDIIKIPGNEVLPAFGAGCCMGLFNDLREKNYKYLKSQENG